MDQERSVCSSVFCTVWDPPIDAPSRMHCRQSLEGRSHFLPPAVKYSVRPEIIWDLFQGLALFKYAGNNGRGIKWSTASHSKGSRGFESTARVSHNTIESWSAVYIYGVVISYWRGEPLKSCQQLIFSQTVQGLFCLAILNRNFYHYIIS